jgi:hypothetical protein
MLPAQGLDQHTLRHGLEGGYGFPRNLDTFLLTIGGFSNSSNKLIRDMCARFAVGNILGDGQ